MKYFGTIKEPVNSRTALTTTNIVSLILTNETNLSWEIAYLHLHFPGLGSWQMRHMQQELTCLLQTAKHHYADWTSSLCQFTVILASVV